MKESGEVIRTIKWISKNLTIWGNICNLRGNDLKYEDIIKMLQNLVENEMYQIALIIMESMRDTVYGEEAIWNLIPRMIGDTGYGKGVITEYIEELSNIVERNNALNQTIML